MLWLHAAQPRRFLLDETPGFKRQLSGLATFMGNVVQRRQLGMAGYGSCNTLGPGGKTSVFLSNKRMYISVCVT